MLWVRLINYQYIHAVKHKHKQLFPFLWKPFGSFNILYYYEDWAILMKCDLNKRRKRNLSATVY